MEKNETISLAFDSSIVQINGMPKHISAEESDVLRTLADNAPDLLSSRDIASYDARFVSEPQLVSAALRRVIPKVNALEDVITRAHRNRQARSFGLLPNVILEELAQPVVFQVSDPFWQSRANCGPNNGDLFVRDNNGAHGDPDNVRRSLCGPCPVRFDCLSDAILNGNTDGIRGGYLPHEIAPFLMAEPDSLQ